MNRPTVTDEQINGVFQNVIGQINRRLKEKGRGAYASIHEAYGIISEEFNKEAMDAMHGNNTPLFMDELVDTAVACIFGVASIIAHKEQKDDTAIETPPKPKQKAKRTKKEAMIEAKALGFEVV